MLQLQTRGHGLGVEVGDGSSAIQAEPHDSQTTVAQVRRDPEQHLAFRAWGEEGHRVAGAHCGVERFRPG